MTTNKPEVVAWYTPPARDALPVVALNDRSKRGEPLIRLSDYEALQAECEKLRKDAEATRKSVKLLNYMFARNIIAILRRHAGANQMTRPADQLDIASELEESERALSASQLHVA